MNIFRKILLIALLFLYKNIILGQISTEEEPISFGRSISALSRNASTHKVLPSLDMNRIEQEDIADETNGIPPRFGFPHKVNYDLNNSGEWTVLSDSSKIWRLSISCPDALSINLLYDQFWLPEGAKFFIYSNDRKHTIGAFTSENNKGERSDIQGFATELIHSDHITLEYYLPNNVEEIGVISISYVVHGYRYIFSLDSEQGRGNSGSCQVNVNCAEGTNYYMEKYAVAKIVMGNRLCTGALVNTTAQNHQPYFLTANHCLCTLTDYNGNCIESHDAVNDNSPNLNYWSFWWHYEANNCGGSTSTHKTTSGAKLVANNEDSDFALLKLTEDTHNKKNVTPYYLGWDRSGNAEAGGVCIHHPSGDIKKISGYTMIPQSTDYLINTINPSATHWRVIWVQTTTNHGVTEGGSSGSPLFNNNRKIIGQLHGGYASCSATNQPDWYGKFSVSWTSNNNPDNRRRLDYWLDPSGTGYITIDGCAAKCEYTKSISNKTYSGHYSAEEACVFNFNNVTFKDDATAKFYARDVIRLNQVTKAEKGAKIRFIATGCREYTREPSMLSATFNTDNINNSNNDTMPLSVKYLQEETKEKEIILHPNPNTGIFTLSTNIDPQEIISIKVLTPLGLLVCEQAGLSNSTIQLPPSAKGLFFVEIQTTTQRYMKKMVVRQ